MVSRVSPVAGAVLLWAAGLPAADRPSSPGKPPAGEDAAPRALAGKWSRADGIDKMLAFPPAKEIPAALEFTLDDKPGTRWEAAQAREIRAEFDRIRHRIVATALVRAVGHWEKREWVITHHDGATYGCGVVPNFGIVIHRLALIPGATADRDLLFVEWGVEGGKHGLVSAYQRAPK